MVQTKIKETKETTTYRLTHDLFRQSNTYMSKKSVNKKIQEVVDKIVREFKPEKVILFGSHAWGEPTEDSDVDLFVIKNVEDTRSCAREIDGSIVPRPFPLDVLVYNQEQVNKSLARNNFFIKNIFSKGRLLYAA
ncbi:MAG: DNA polymerase subunit beta [Parcubacteria group bacterium Gr01-1014_48]|nr:MAG: DNA polymerase subunit beta [Parcubacteria group bacterium Greene0416_14]TSC73937.1 MAG: DNA polymerase subunit beta [Parcubacteria group bacterium Gr01-1014_48]TSD00947.1 MAG: DNA polymerase subunit beta [Parcubacteria group bacterium Greene1014_15]TSD07898.1 MAG: DNA polymerase subunit beta [Parcubacteria group bacterium Greene0714_4]